MPGAANEPHPVGLVNCIAQLQFSFILPVCSRKVTAHALGASTTNSPSMPLDFGLCLRDCDDGCVLEGNPRGVGRMGTPPECPPWSKHVHVVCNFCRMPCENLV